MSSSTLNIIKETSQLIIEKSRPKLSMIIESGLIKIIKEPTILSIPRNTAKILSIGMQGPAGPPGPVGAGMAALENDSSPSLGGDLNLNGFQIIGPLDTTSFTIDGGLV